MSKSASNDTVQPLIGVVPVFRIAMSLVEPSNHSLRTVCVTVPVAGDVPPLPVPAFGASGWSLDSMLWMAVVSSKLRWALEPNVICEFGLMVVAQLFGMLANV